MAERSGHCRAVHRVNLADGPLCDYGSKLRRKQWLLDYESRSRSPAS
ncbi:MAG: hypothetical protein H7Y39_11850 [Nitrospiraceae bacterium]|nr:hypothetical protein [Nitrospiraceae bacterium]